MASPTYRVSSRLHSPAARAGGNTATREPQDWLLLAQDQTARSENRQPANCLPPNHVDIRRYFRVNSSWWPQRCLPTDTSQSCLPTDTSQSSANKCRESTPVWETNRPSAHKKRERERERGGFRSSGMLREVSWQVVTDVSGKHIGPSVKVTQSACRRG
jgi:hypothetical protein